VCERHCENGISVKKRRGLLNINTAGFDGNCSPLFDLTILSQVFVDGQLFLLIVSSHDVTSTLTLYIASTVLNPNDPGDAVLNTSNQMYTCKGELIDEKKCTPLIGSVTCKLRLKQTINVRTDCAVCHTVRSTTIYDWFSGAL
jgi:hypothetical protein